VWKDVKGVGFLCLIWSYEKKKKVNFEEEKKKEFFFIRKREKV